MKVVANAAAAVGHRVSDRLSHLWWVVLSRGILVVLFGIAALIWPQKSLTALVFLAGGYLLLDGAAGLVQAFGSGDFLASLVQGLASAAAGVALLVWPSVSASVLLAILGAWAVVQGIGLLQSGREIRADGEDGGVLLSIGAILVAFGVVALVWRGVGAVAVAWLISLVALVVGGLMIYGARRLKGVRERLDSVGSARA